MTEPLEDIPDATVLAGRFALAVLHQGHGDGDSETLALIVDEIRATPNGPIDVASILALCAARLACSLLPEDPERFFLGLIQTALDEGLGT